MKYSEDRKYWVETLIKIAAPVLQALAKGRLKADMPVEHAPGVKGDRREYAPLEALGRLLSGISPWLECSHTDEEEDLKRKSFCVLSRKAIVSATDPDSPDYINFRAGHQILVDAAFLCHAILRAPNELWNKLDENTKANLIRELKATRSIRPSFNNWLLFSAMIETALFKAGEEWDKTRVDYAIKQHEEWYKGDGAYGDGPEFHWDYYNSFVIQPMLTDIILTVGNVENEWEKLKPAILARAKRYGEVQERLIASDGTFPPIGRSIAYRTGAFQHLAQMAFQHNLAQGVHPSQVRCALTAVIRRSLEPEGTFDEQGWLKIGFCGSQPDVAEGYITTGSLYLCSTVFLPLGLSIDDDFWADKPREWTQKKMWSGQIAGADHALHV